MIGFDNLSDDELEQLRAFIDQSDFILTEGGTVTLIGNLQAK